MTEDEEDIEDDVAAINAQIIATGAINGMKPFLKSLMTCCFLLSCLARYMNSASFARSLV